MLKQLKPFLLENKQKQTNKQTKQNKNGQTNKEINKQYKTKQKQGDTKNYFSFSKICDMILFLFSAARN